MPSMLSITTIVLAAALLAPSVAHAYVDPGTGSMVLQGVIAGILGVGLTLKLYWRRIRTRLTGNRPNDKPGRDDETDADQ